MRHVVGHALPSEDCSVPWSARDRLLAVGTLGGGSGLVLWAEQDCDENGDPAATYGPRPLAVVPTGGRVPVTWEYAGTAVLTVAGAVHVYAAPMIDTR